MIVSTAMDHPRLRHRFFTREGGVSEGIYAGLQCGWGALGDTPQNVAANRAIAAAALDLPPPALVTAHQVHSARAVVVTAPFAREEAPEADALVTNRPGIGLGILTADCVPILFADAQAGVIGAAHAGWKGALGGVIEATMAAMEPLGAERGQIVAAIGPCIRQDAYQVDDGYHDRFVTADPANARFFVPDGEAGKWRFDLAGYCSVRLMAAGAATVDDSARCTYAEDRLFYSNRRALHRGEGDYGRGLSVIRLI